jgi:putative ATPase
LPIVLLHAPSPGQVIIGQTSRIWFGVKIMPRRNPKTLFSEPEEEEAVSSSSSPAAPLAERMRPRTLSEFVGQSHLVGEGRVLRRLIEGAGALPSLILWGAPGTGKTTLARLLAEKSGAHFVALSAVFSGVKEARAAISEARETRRQGERTILFIDEIHRFNKGQQDALLPAVEDGTVTLIGATTENPSFEVTGALLSRSRVLVLNPLTERDVQTILRRALEDEERGLAALRPELSDELIARLAHSAGGDARVGLAALEAAVEATVPDEDGVRRVQLETLIEALGRAAYAYDKGGEEHYNLASALIKSLRNSDVNAALYWLARLIEGGADPVFIARRLCILASEDIGLADPQAMVQAAAAADITRLIGLPEALYPLSQATIYLAQAPKSNSVKRAYYAAMADAAETAREPVPMHLRNAITPLMKRVGYGGGYRYVHSDPRAKEEMACLPAQLSGKVYYNDEQPADGDQQEGEHC